MKWRVPFLDLSAQNEDVAHGIVCDIQKLQKRLTFIQDEEVAFFEREFAEF